jgi:ATP synthase protein I
MKKEEDGSAKYRGWRVAAQLSSVGLTLALSIGVGIGLGLLLDRWFNTGGILVIIFTIVGVAAGFKQLIQTVIRAGKEQDAIDRDRRSGPGG